MTHEDPKRLAKMAARLRESSESVGGWPIMEETAAALESMGALQQEVEALREQLERAKNWKRLVMECENLLGKQYRDNKGHFYTFFGLVHSNDDYYYGMWRPGEMNLLSCVGSMETHGFELVAAIEDGETKP